MRKLIFSLLIWLSVLSFCSGQSTTWTVNGTNYVVGFSNNTFVITADGVPIFQAKDSDLDTFAAQGETAYFRLNRNNNTSPNTTNTMDDLIVTNAFFKADPDFGEKVLRRVGEIKFDGVGDGIITMSNNTQRLALSGGTLANERTSGGFLTLGGVDDDANPGDAILGAGTNGGLVQLISEDGAVSLTVDNNGINVLKDVFVTNGSGIVVGHTSKVDFGAIPEFQVLGTGAPDSSMGFARFSANSGGPTVRFLKSRSGTIGVNTIVQDGDELGRFRFQAADGDDFNTTGAEISAEVDGTPGANDMPTRLLFKTTSDGESSAKTRMFIDNTGLVTMSNALDLVGQGGISNITSAVNDDDVPSFAQAKNAGILTNDLPHSVFGTNTGTSGQILSTTDGINQKWIDTVFTNTESFTWTLNGNIGTGTEIDGYRIMSATGTIDRVWITLGDRGNNGDTIVDINIGSLSGTFTTQQNAIAISTIYTNQANRPTLAGLNGSSDDNSFIEAATPDISVFDNGDFLSVDIDSTVAQNADLVVTVYVKYD